MSCQGSARPRSTGARSAAPGAVDRQATCPFSAPRTAGLAPANRQAKAGATGPRATVPPMDITAYRDRRSRLADQLRRAGGGIAILPTAPERPRNADSDHPYRHDSHFHYLTGFDEPG
ncbi:MAG: aminopeptidase P N-terminal domain-containing protein, partial [Caldimonas sp.]